MCDRIAVMRRTPLAGGAPGRARWTNMVCCMEATGA